MISCFPMTKGVCICVGQGGDVGLGMCGPGVILMH